MNDSQLADKARGVAACLTYNEDEAQSHAKHILLECAHRLDSRVIKVHKKKDGLFLINARGKCRYATWKETLVYWFNGSTPKEI